MIYRNPALLRLARLAPRCMNPQCAAPNRGDVVAAHSNQLRDGKGRGLKAHDYRIAFLCSACHHAIDQGARLSRSERVELWEDAHRATIGWLFDNGFLVLAQQNAPGSWEPGAREPR